MSDKNGDAFEMKREKIVVMGGSFNPPTIAHLKLMLAAVEGVAADRGVFVPTSFTYVGRKMHRAKSAPLWFSEEMRLKMLTKMCADDSRLAVDVREFGAASPQTLETLSSIALENPDAEVFFIIGADKLNDMKRWGTRGELLDRFRFIVFERHGEQVRQRILEDVDFRDHADSFVVLSPPQGVDGISSTEVRERFYAGGSCEELLHPDVWQMLVGTRPDDYIRSPDQLGIMQFDGDYDFLSNFYPVKVEFGGLVYDSAEAAFQAQKCENDDERKLFVGVNAGQSKRIGRHVHLRSDWEVVKVGIMERVVRAKFFQHPDLAEKLVATGAIPLTEGNTWFDICWGVDAYTGRGENHLGKILMKIRDELKCC